MNIDTLKAMLELKALQNFGTNNSSSTSTLSFQDLLNCLLTEDEVTALSEPLNGDSSSGSNVTSTMAKTTLPPLSLLNSTGNIGELVNKASESYNIPAKLINAVIKQESDYNPNAVSTSGAAGLMQLTPATASSLGVDDIFNPAQNIDAGSKYLKQMLDRYDGNIELALAAYNAGPGNVDKYGGIPPFEETQNYVKKITNSYYA